VALKALEVSRNSIGLSLPQRDHRDIFPRVQEKSPIDRLIWLNGRLVPWGAATVHVLSHSLQRGSLVFDYMSVHQTPRGPGVFRIADHIDRMLQSCSLMGLPIDWTAAELAEGILEAVRANPDATAVKASAYFASVEVDVVPVDQRVSVAIAAYDPQRDILDRLPGGRPVRRRPLRIWLEKKAHQRREDIVSPHAKVSANYASSMTAKGRAQREGFDEILLVDEEGWVAEGPTTNVFIVDSKGALLTPLEKKVLQGVTRRSLIELARADGFEVREQGIRPEQLFEAQEVFLTGTTAGVAPVESVDGHVIGESCPGPIAKSLHQHFQRVVSGEDPNYIDWLTFVDGEAPVVGEGA